MENTIKNYGQLYHPSAMLVFYEGENQKQAYVEHFSFDFYGLPHNAHPLTVQEAAELSKALVTDDVSSNFLSQKLLPAEILHLDPIHSKVVWYSKAQIRDLHFSKGLGLTDGPAHVPAMLWIADRKKLNVYALKSNKRPTLDTEIFHAPFFNLYENGNVCMGTVNVDQDNTDTVELFIKKWEQYFFHSNFSHLIAGHNPIKGNCIQLWEKLISRREKFPTELLIKTGFKLNDLL